MNDFLLGLRLTENEIRSVLIDKQREGKLTNEAMCIILKDLIADYEEGTVNEYARNLAGMMMELSKRNEPAQAEEPEAKVDDNTESET